MDLEHFGGFHVADPVFTLCAAPELKHLRVSLSQEFRDKLQSFCASILRARKALQNIILMAVIVPEEVCPDTVVIVVFLSIVSQFFSSNFLSPMVMWNSASFLNAGCGEGFRLWMLSSPHLGMKGSILFFLRRSSGTPLRTLAKVEMDAIKAIIPMMRRVISSIMMGAIC